MRILRYSKKVQLRPWLSFSLVDEREVKEHEVLGEFDRLCEAVRASGFDFVIVDRPDEVLIERSDGQGSDGA